ncbi:amidohydrolase [Terrimesophilobacter mesophilus]|uniref:Amidohydrolase n=1 Tax=Terrimesophilobacter mesophilus TaxID=433647 RepID=A0A4R8VDB6_9MICO|nr:amidohydrolase [Terrimesophilobacter mesophilus]
MLAGYLGIQPWQEDLYRDLHRHPELGHHETRSASIAATVLREAGFDVHDTIGTTGVVGVLRNGDGPVVLMRADMDALPMAEKTGLDYASTDRATDDAQNDVPVAHACGHDVHMACLMAAARLMAAEHDSWSGTYIALFQPAEEIATGASAMVDGGLTTLIPKPDVALAQHVLAFPSGRVGVRPGAFLSGADSMRITVHGRGSHGSMPQLSVDPVVLAAMIVVRLQAIVAREIAPDDFAVLTVGRISAGTKSNIISDHAVLELNLRTYSDATRSALLAAIERVVRGECAASGSPLEPEFELYDHFPLTDNDSAASSRVDTAFRTHFGAEAFTIDRQSASEDFSEMPNAFGSPYVYWGIGGVDPGAYAAAEAAGTVATTIPANHSPQFAPVIEPTLRTGTAAAVVAAMAWLAHPESGR